MKGLIVYNTCGLGGKENTGWYLSCINAILSQRGDFEVAVSSCCNSLNARGAIKQQFGSKVMLNCIDEKLPVNITFNATVRACVAARGKYDYYVYVDSGIHFASDMSFIEEIEKRFQNDDVGMVTVQASNDNGFLPWLGLPSFVTGEDFEVPVGRACNAHVFAYSSDYYEKFRDRLWPDIFVAYCTESVFSFMTAAIGKKWIIVKDKIAYHAKGAIGADGASAGFDHIGGKGEPWNNLLAGLDMVSILTNPEAWNSGFGYEEVNKVFLHNSNAYDESGKCKDPDRLLAFLNDNVFLSPEVLNYESIPHLLV